MISLFFPLVKSFFSLSLFPYRPPPRIFFDFSSKRPPRGSALRGGVLRAGFSTRAAGLRLAAVLPRGGSAVRGGFARGGSAPREGGCPRDGVCAPMVNFSRTDDSSVGFSCLSPAVQVRSAARVSKFFVSLPAAGLCRPARFPARFLTDFSSECPRPRTLFCGRLFPLPRFFRARAFRSSAFVFPPPRDGFLCPPPRFPARVSAGFSSAQALLPATAVSRFPHGWRVCAALRGGRRRAVVFFLTEK